MASVLLVFSGWRYHILRQHR